MYLKTNARFSEVMQFLQCKRCNGKAFLCFLHHKTVHRQTLQRLADWAYP